MNSGGQAAATGLVTPPTLRPRPEAAADTDRGRLGAVGARLSGWGDRFIRLVRRHPLMSAFLAIGAALRLLALITYQPALMLYGDSYGYLKSESTLTPDPWHPMGYPLLLRALSVTHWLPAVPLLQHLAGLGLGLAIYAFLRRRGARNWLAALAAAPVLLDAYQIDVEQFILAEVLFECLMVGALGALMWRKLPTRWAVAGCGLLLGLAAITRPVATVGLPLVIAYLFMRGLGWRRAAGLAIAITLAFCIPTVAYATWAKSIGHDFALGDNGGYFLYANAAPVADCNLMFVPENERALCAKVSGGKQGPNFYLWDARSPMRGVQVAEGPNTSKVLQDFALRVISHRPVPFALQGLSEVGHYFAPVRYSTSLDWYQGTWVFPGHTVEDSRWHVDYATIGFDQGRVDPQTIPALQTFLRGYQKIFFTPGPILALGILLPLIAWARRRGSWRLRLDALLLAAFGLAMLVVPSFTACFDYRYALPTLVLLVPAAALGLLALDLPKVGRDAEADDPGGADPPADAVVAP
jgi:hypothetical protein